MNRRGFLRSLGLTALIPLAAKPVVAAIAEGLSRPRTPTGPVPSLFDPKNYMGDLEWVHLSDGTSSIEASPWFKTDDDGKPSELYFHDGVKWRLSDPIYRYNFVRHDLLK